MVLLRVVGLGRAAETATIVLLSLAGVLLGGLLISTMFLVAFVTFVGVSLEGSALRARVRVLIGLLRPECILVSGARRRIAVLLFVEKAWFRSLESDLLVLGS